MEKQSNYLLEWILSKRDDCHPTKRRLLAVLDYDGIPECERIKHLMNKCNISRYMAKRALNGALPRSWDRASRIADGIDVCFGWMRNGEFWKFHPRTARIQMVAIDGESMADAEDWIRSISSDIPGEPKYKYFCRHDSSVEPISLREIIYLEQHRRMSEWERTKYFRLMVRLNNGDSKARRLLEMSARGQITRQQMLSVV